MSAPPRLPPAPPARLTLPAVADTGPTWNPRDDGALCDSCPLAARGKPVPSTLIDKPRLVIIGEGPGRLEERLNRVFVGPSGKTLNNYLREAKFRREDASVLNAVACRLDTDDADIMARATVCCAPRLAREVATIPKNVPILTLGKSATRSVLGTNGIMKARGFVWTAPDVPERKLNALKRLIERKYARSPAKRAVAQASLTLLQARATYAGRTVLPSVHPAHVLRNELWGPILSIDIDRAIRFVKARESGTELPLRDEARYEIARTPFQLQRKLEKLRKEKRVVVDIETTSKDAMTCEITCVGIGSLLDPGFVIVAWPWHPAMAPVLARFTRNRIGVGHNIISFDEPALARFGVTFEDVEDTLIGQHSVVSHLPKSLSQLVSQFVDARPWKIIHRGGSDEKGLSAFDIENENLPVYNSSDVSLTAFAYLAMQPDLDPERHVYEHDLDLGRVCRDMRGNGMAMDVEQRDMLSFKLGKRADALLGRMRTLTKNRRFDPNKAIDIRKALYGRFHQPVVELTKKTHQPSTAMGTLQALREREGTKAGDLADLIIRRRSALKTKSSFVDGVELGDDGRVHFQWKLGPVTGRLASAGVAQLLPKYCEGRCPTRGCGYEKPKGFTGNLVCPRCKNNGLPTSKLEWSYEDMPRSMFVAAPGHVWVYFDLKQSEARGAAYISDDENFIRTCEQGDVHTNNACVMFPEFADAIRADPSGVGKQYRDIIKNVNFGLLYGAEAEKVYATLVDKGFPVEFPQCVRALMNARREYRQYYKYCDANVAFVQEHGWLRTELLGRIRWFGRFPKPTEVYNFKVQSFIADLMNQRLIAMWKRGFPDGVRLIAQIHDACIFECREELAESWLSEIKRVWDEPVTIPRTGRQFVCPIDTKTGTRWSELG